MNEAFQRFLVNKNFGTILFDVHFNIIAVDTIAEKIVEPVGPVAVRDDLLAMFPEFIGCEKFIQDVLRMKEKDFRLDYINRSIDKGQTRVLNLIVLPEDPGKIGLLVIDDVTEQAQHLQKINQQRYELFLYKCDADFRKKFLRESILGNSEPIRQVIKIIDKLSHVPTATVLLAGETGSGKNLVARVIHYSSMAAAAPFVDINCAALPEHLLESELFGYEKGAFTHATVSRPGLLEEAQGGTIFLDEIGELPLNMQAKLLQVIETKQFRRLGSNKTIAVKARIISATNRDLQKEIGRKTFREDLFYRLNVVTITLPPLRQLEEDIMMIAEHLLKIFNIEFKKQVKGFSEDARQALRSYSWPGNVRELSNCLERAMIFIDKQWIEASDLVIVEPLTSPTVENIRQWTLPPDGIVLEDVERQLIVAALRQAGDNKSKAARLLGLSRDTLRYRLEKYQLV